MGEYDAALADITRAIELKPNSEWFYLERARLRIAYMRQFPEGIMDCDEALRINPQNFNAPLHRARAHARLGNHAAAIKDAAAGFKLSPDSALRRNVLNEVLRTCGTPETLEGFDELKEYLATVEGDTQKTEN
jgi:tetratricopeptide (TPR) repeat protein